MLLSEGSDAFRVFFKRWRTRLNQWKSFCPCRQCSHLNNVLAFPVDEFIYLFKKKCNARERQNGIGKQKIPEDSRSRHLWLINYHGVQTTTSTLALGYPLLGPSHHVPTYCCMPQSSPGVLCSNSFRHETFRPSFRRLAASSLVLGCSRPLCRR